MASSSSKFGWSEIIAKVFDNKNTLLLTAASALSSAVICTVAYIYQRIILLGWGIPAEFIGGARNETVIYYIGFGILYALVTIIHQIVLRYVSLNTCIVISLYGVQKRVVKAAKHYTKVKIGDKCLRTKHVSRAKQINKEINGIIVRALVKELLKDIGITILSLIPAYIMFQLVSPNFSLSSLGLLTPLVLICAICCGLMQAVFLLPQGIRELIEKSKHMNKNDLDEIDGVLKAAHKVAMEQLANEKPDTEKNILERMWNTVSRVDVYSAVITVVLNSLLSLFLASGVPVSQKNFWTFSYATEEQAYVAVYFDGENAVFKRATIEGDIAIIHLREQLYETYIGKNMINRRFSKTILDDGALNRLERTILRE